MDKQSVDAWYAEQAVRINSSPETMYFTSHVYEIDSSFCDGKNDITNAINVLILVDRLVKNDKLGVVAKLGIELGWSEVLDTSMPILKDLPIPQSLSDRQPAIYLIRPEVFGMPHRREVYRRAYTESPWGADLVVEYECERSLDDWWAGDEFGRQIWVQSRA